MSARLTELEVARLADTVRKIEARVAQPERALVVTGGEVKLVAGEGSIEIKRTSIHFVSKDVPIRTAGHIECKASGEVRMKGSKVLQN